jgi:hypothetical protein
MPDTAMPMPKELIAQNAEQIQHGRKVLTKKTKEDITGIMFDVEWVDGVQRECGEVVES